MANKIKFKSDDEISTYDLTDSEEEDGYTATERKLLRNYTNNGVDSSSEEEEVYALKSDVEDNNADSDIEDNDDYLPDDRAWGKKKKSYYSTDYVDNDLNGFQEKDVDEAQLEAEEAKKIQQRLLDQFDEDDFNLDGFKPKETVKEKKGSTIKIKPDILEKEKQDLLLQESPELIGLIEDFNDKLTEFTEKLAPILDLVNAGLLEEDEFVHYIRLKYNVTMRYLIYINFYLLLKSQRVNTKYHPAIKQIVQYKDLYNQLESANNETLSSKIETIIAQGKNYKPKPKKLLKTLEKRTKKRKSSESEEIEEENPEPQIKKVHFESESEDQEEDETEPTKPEEESKEDTPEEVQKRAITYQMAKNKGLTPKRKKEQRNPRVKHRNKFRQAKIRRKGAVREVRKELARYGGEISGIKTHVSKSIKIK